MINERLEKIATPSISTTLAITENVTTCLKKISNEAATIMKSSNTATSKCANAAVTAATITAARREKKTQWRQWAKPKQLLKINGCSHLNEQMRQLMDALIHSQACKPQHLYAAAFRWSSTYTMLHAWAAALIESHDYLQPRLFFSCAHTQPLSYTPVLVHRQGALSPSYAAVLICSSSHASLHRVGSHRWLQSYKVRHVCSCAHI